MIGGRKGKGPKKRLERFKQFKSFKSRIALLPKMFFDKYLWGKAFCFCSNEFLEVVGRPANKYSRQTSGQGKEGISSALLAGPFLFYRAYEFNGMPGISGEEVICKGAENRMGCTIFRDIGGFLPVPPAFKRRW